MLMHSVLDSKSVSTLLHHTLLVHQCLRFCPLILTDMSCSLVSLARTLPTSTMQYCAYVLYLLPPLTLLNNLQTQVGHSNFIFRSVSLTSSQSAWQSRLLYTFLMDILDGSKSQWWQIESLPKKALGSFGHRILIGRL